MRNLSSRILSSLLFLFIGTLGFTQLKQSTLEQYIPQDGLSHPYLLFDQAGKAEMLKSAEENPELKAIYDRLIMEAYRFLKMPVLDEMPQGGDLSRFFAGSDYRRFVGIHNEAAVNLAFVYQLTGDKRYAAKAYQHAEMLCKLESWVYPFHEFPQIYDRVWPWGVEDDQVVFSYDLQSARIATHLALVYDWTYDAMDKGQRDRIRGALLEKAITRVRGNFEYHWWSSAARCNWSGICFSGAGIASLALLNEDPHLTDVIVPAYNGVSRMLDEIGPDGGWQEGRGYWAYGVGHSVWFMDAIRQLSGGTHNLFMHPRIKENPVDFALYTLPANFGDGRSGPVGSSWFINKLAGETGDQTAAWYSQEFIRQGATLYDLIWPKSSVEPVEPAIKSKQFRGIDWAVLRSSFKSTPSFTLASKAGLNDDPHHGHLDCGQFILDYNGVSVIKDLGGAKYDDFYFSAERWDYMEASSKGHNVIYVNGEEQISAKLKDQPWKEGVGGQIADFHTSEQKDGILMTGLQKAYPGEELSSWEREIVLYKPSLLVVADLVGSDKDAEIRSRIHPAGDVQVKQGYYVIESSEGPMAVVPYSNRELKIEAGRSGSITVNESADFEWVPHVDCVVNAASRQTISGYIIFPLSKEENVMEVLSTLDLDPSGSGAYDLSFELEQEKYQMSFNGKIMNK
jgi:hypothetical protein